MSNFLSGFFVSWIIYTVVYLCLSVINVFDIFYSLPNPENIIVIGWAMIVGLGCYFSEKYKLFKALGAEWLCV